MSIERSQALAGKIIPQNQTYREPFIDGAANKAIEGFRKERGISRRDVFTVLDTPHVRRDEVFDRHPDLDKDIDAHVQRTVGRSIFDATKR